MKKYIIIFGLLILVVAGFFIYQGSDNDTSDQTNNNDQTPNQTVQDSTTPTATTNATPTSATSTISAKGVKDVVLLDLLKSGQMVSSPLTIKGKAKGWYFEGSFPVEIRDSNNKIIASGPAQAKSDWMSTDYVPFEIKLTFAKQVAGSMGIISFKKDNPSGLPQNEDEVIIPVTF